MRSHDRQKLARIALDEMYQFVAVLDPCGTLLEVNRAALEGAGLKLSDVEGKPFWQCFWWGVSTEIQETLRSAIARAAQGDFIRYDVEIYGKASGNETIIIDFSMIPVKDQAGNVAFIVPEGRDITDKKEYEREIAQKNTDLQALLERIRELDEIKMQFFANVSHELRTPLALIIGPAERLITSGSTMRLEEQRETADVIVRNARMLLKHVNDLLDISKLEERKLKIELHETDVSALVRFIASHFDILAAERQINFCVETTPLHVSAVDPEKLQRVLMNLLSNAFKFVPTGGTVRCILEVSRNGFVLSVEDSGPGVKPELRHAIFERFRQGDGGADRRFGGTGLGLAIAKEFVEMHRGSIEVLESQLGGALFQVTLPAPRLFASSAETLPSPALPFDRGTLDGLIEELRLPITTPLASDADEVEPTTRPTVLIVEDNPDMNRFIAQCLSHDYHVVSAFDGQQGLEQALALKPALIVSDIMMPKVSGVQMIAELRTHPEMLETPILLLSAKADEEMKNRLLEEGAQDFITKPFTERDLLVRARNLIAVNQSRDELRDAERTKRLVLEAGNRDLQTARGEAERARVAAEQANRAKGAFLAVMSHELRTPLNAIGGYAQLMELGIHGAISPEQHEDLERIQRSQRLLLGHIDQILNYARIESSSVVFNLANVRLDEMIRATEELIEPQLRAKGLRYTYSGCAPDLVVCADGEKLQQILVNLLSNAIKFTNPAGKISVNVEESERVLVHVRDTGIGISPEQIGSIFEPFMQVDVLHMQRRDGVGLGLAISRELAGRMAGDIVVESVQGIGSTFTLRLQRGKPPE